MEQSLQLKPLALTPPMNVMFVNGPDQLEPLFNFFKTTPERVIGWDIETTPHKDFFWRRCRTMQFGITTEQYVVDLLGLCDGDPELLDRCQGDYGKNLHLAPKLKAFLDHLSEVFLNNKFLKVGVNLAFEYEVHRWSFGLRPWNFYSADLVERCIWAGAHSLKDYGFYSMADMFGRYFGMEVDKSLQMSFDLSTPLTLAQIEYAAIDTRLPLGIRKHQLKITQRDGLDKAAQIENDAIGAFVDMHIHGENINTDQWLARTYEFVAKLKDTITKLDEIFIPICGNKTDVVTDAEIAKLESDWKAMTAISPRELELKALMRKEKDIDCKIMYGAEKDLLELGRKNRKDEMKAVCSERKKLRTKMNKLVAKCEGDALINYGSGAQLLDVLIGMKGLKKLPSTNDNDLVKYKDVPVIALIRDYREYTKQIDTYGVTWTKKWTNKPCADEGWLHPGDGKLHCKFNQYEAETGRSSSSQPNAQNIPQDKALRSCFVADQPNENIRVSKCCCADTILTLDRFTLVCTNCKGTVTYEETTPEEYVIITADMSGAELRIIAEEADAKSWIEAFARGEDVHSVGTEILYGERWKSVAVINGEVKGKPYSCEYYKVHTAESAAKTDKVLDLLGLPRVQAGDPMKQKCECPEHKKLRDGNKSTNFLLAYGGTAHTLSERIGVTFDEAVELMALHEAKFPDIWAYLEASGKAAKINNESRTMFGRRRLFPKPTWERAKEKFMQDYPEKLEHSEAYAAAAVEKFTKDNGRKPSKGEEFLLTHRQPIDKEIAKSYKAMSSSIERQGKNQPIQGANADIVKLAMGTGYDEIENKPYLWHIFPLYRAKLLKLVHDELVAQVPKHYAEKVKAEMGDAFRRAARERMTKVIMEFEAKIAPYWSK